MRWILGALAFITGGVASAATLDEVLAAAADYAPDGRAADAVAARVQATVRQGRSLLGPTLSASGTYLLNNYEVRFASGGQDVVIQPLHYGQAAFALTQPLSPAGLAAQRALEPDLAASRADRTAAREALTLTVIGAYFDLLVAQEAVGVQQGLLDLAQAQERLVETRQSVGMSQDRAVLQAKLSTSRARRELEASTAALVAAQEGLRVLTGRAETEALEWPAVPVLFEAETSERDEVAAASSRVEAARRRVRSAWTLWMPDLAVGLTYSLTGNAGFTGRNDLLTGQVGATWNLPVAGAHVHQRAAWTADLRIAEAGLRATTDAVTQQVATARAELARTQAAQAAMADELALAERHHDLTVRAFELGAATSLEVDEAQAQVRAARLGALRERARVAVASFAVVWAEGRLGR